MSDLDIASRLRRANPLPENPPPPSIEPLLARLDQTVRPLDRAIAPAPPHHGETRLRGPAIACAASAIIALVLFATVGSSGGGAPDVLADVYRALTPGTGVLHVVEITEQTTAANTTTSREELWTAQNPRRLRTVTTLPGGETYENTFSASPLESLKWSAREPHVILRGTPVGALSHEATPVSVLRELYAKGELTLAEKTVLEGRSVWQLTVHPQYTLPEYDGKPVAAPSVFVDASTFQPVEMLSQSVIQGSTGLELQLSKVRYVTYEETPQSAQADSLLKLAGHPGAVEKSEP
jgi:hypothetical protein